MKQFSMIQYAGIYLSSFTTVRFFKTKIEFSNAVKCRWVLEVKYVLQRVRGGALLGVQEVKPLKNGGLFTSGE